MKIEFPALPENETKEVVFEIRNTSQKNYMLEMIPPNFQLTGILINPLVVPLSGGKSALVSFKYHSKFREFNARTLEELYKPKIKDGDIVPKGMVRNKLLEERLAKKKKDQESA